MLLKVKKFRDKIFSGSKKGMDVDGLEEQSTSTGGLRSQSSLSSPKAARRDGSSARLDPMDIDMVQAHKPGGSSRSPDSPSSSMHHTVLPPVQISNNSFSPQQAAAAAQQAGAAPPMPPGLNTLLSPSGTGRRKSTPAALDMALRTAEGKAAVEELLGINHNKKQLMFPQYFAGQGTAQAPGQQQTTAAAAAQAAKGAAAAAAAQAAVPQQSALAAGRFQKLHPPLGFDSMKGMAPVPEDDDQMSEATKVPQQSRVPKALADSVSSFDHAAPAPTSPNTSALLAKQKEHAAALAAAAAAAVPPPQLLPVPQYPQQPAQPQPAMVVPQQPVAPPVQEEVPPSKRTKVIVVSPNLPVAMQRKVWCLGDFNIIRKMYTGYASTVYQALCKKSLEMVALKVYHMENLCELNHYQVYREIRVHSDLCHQQIVHLYCAFQEGTDVVLVQEYAEGGDLYRLLHKNGGRLSERQAVEMVLHPFLLALHYLHTKGIMHRDIKPENVLFTEHRVLKLADFGLAIDLTEERAVTRAGTLDYMAPEVLRCPPKNLPQENKNNPYLHYNNSVDAWAVGVFAYELVVGFPPFAGETQLDSVDKIMHAVPEFPEKLSDLAKDFICQALKKHPGDRPTVMEMLHHPWIRTFQRRTSMRLPVAPRRRSSVTYNPPTQLVGPGGPGAGYGVPEEPGPGEAPAADINEMTPEQIEEMIRRLQVRIGQTPPSAAAYAGQPTH